MGGLTRSGNFRLGAMLIGLLYPLPGLSCGGSAQNSSCQWRALSDKLEKERPLEYFICIISTRGGTRRNFFLYCDSLHFDPFGLPFCSSSHHQGPEAVTAICSSYGPSSSVFSVDLVPFVSLHDFRFVGGRRSRGKRCGGRSFFGFVMRLGVVVTLGLVGRLVWVVRLCLMMRLGLVGRLVWVIRLGFVVALGTVVTLSLVLRLVWVIRLGFVVTLSLVMRLVFRFCMRVVLRLGLVVMMSRRVLVGLGRVMRLRVGLGWFPRSLRRIVPSLCRIDGRGYLRDALSMHCYRHASFEKMGCGCWDSPQIPRAAREEA